MQERRVNPRLKLNQKVGVILSGGGVAYVRTYDLSPGGLQLSSEYGADLGDHLRIFMNVFDPQVDDYVRIHAQVVVSHVVYDGAERCFRVGVEFTEFEDDGKAIYHRFFDARLYARYGQHLLER